MHFSQKLDMVGFTKILCIRKISNFPNRIKLFFGNILNILYLIIKGFAMELGQYINDGEVCELEQFPTWQENYIFWSKKYLLDKIDSLSSRFLEDKEALNFQKNKLENSKDIEEMKIVINDLSKLKVKGPKLYFNSLYKFYYFLEKVKAKNIKEIDNRVIKAFIVSLSEQNIKDVTRNNIFTVIKNFLKFISSNNIIKSGEDAFDFKITINIKDIIKSRKKTTVDIISPHKEYGLFLDGINEVQFKNDNTRNKLLLKIVYFTGMRVCEVTYLKYKDITIEDKHFAFKIIGKGNKERTLYVAKRDIQDLWKKYSIEKKMKSLDEYVFQNKFGQPLADRTITNYIRKILTLKNIKTTKSSLHLLRHSLVTKLIFEGSHSLEEAMGLLGHEDISTTQIYTHITNEHIKKSASKISQVIKKG